MDSAVRRGPLPTPADLAAVVEGRHADPFAVLGRHHRGSYDTVVCFQPGASGVTLIDADGATLSEMSRIHLDGVFAGRLEAPEYRLRVAWDDGNTTDTHDPYSFGSSFGEVDLHLLGEGKLERLYDKLGYRTMGRLRGYYQGQEDALRLQKDLWCPISVDP